MPKRSKKPSPFKRKAQSITKARTHPEWIKEFDLIRRVIERTHTINRPHVELFSHRPLPRNITDFKIATVSTNLDIDDLGFKTRQDYKVWMVKDKNVRKRLRTEFLSYLEQAGQVGAKFVCFNELAYPTPIDFDEDRRFQGQVKKLAKEHELFVIAGSYHDIENYYNLCPLVTYSGYGSRKPEIHTHAKLTSATKAFEFIRIPPSRDLRHYETSSGSFNVLICIDVYDPLLIFRLMMKNHPFSEEKHLDIIFVPSFTISGGPALAQACQDLSYSAASIVAYVNCGANRPRHALYLAGEHLTANNRNVQCSITEISENITLYEIPYDEYHRMRLKVSDGYSAVLEYLIGQKDGLRFDLRP
jgi:hypothetical protein